MAGCAGAPVAGDRVAAGVAGLWRSAGLTLAGLGALALLLLRAVRPQPARAEQRCDLKFVHQMLLAQRRNPLVTGAPVGAIGVCAALRVEPLGVTAPLGSILRTVLNDAGLLPSRLNGLDTLAGCATKVVPTVTDNGWLIGGFVVASLAAAPLADRFALSRVTPRSGFTAVVGGVLMGWGAMTALGCTVGALLSGISAFALSGWVFAVAVFVGVLVSVQSGLHRI